MIDLRNKRTEKYAEGEAAVRRRKGRDCTSVDWRRGGERRRGYIVIIYKPFEGWKRREKGM